GGRSGHVCRNELDAKTSLESKLSFGRSAMERGKRQLQQGDCTKREGHCWLEESCRKSATRRWPTVLARCTMAYNCHKHHAIHRMKIILIIIRDICSCPSIGMQADLLHRRVARKRYCISKNSTICCMVLAFVEGYCGG